MLINQDEMGNLFFYEWKRLPFDNFDFLVTRIIDTEEVRENLKALEVFLENVRWMLDTVETNAIQKEQTK